MHVGLGTISFCIFWVEIDIAEGTVKKYFSLYFCSNFGGDEKNCSHLQLS